MDRDALADLNAMLDRWGERHPELRHVADAVRRAGGSATPAGDGDPRLARTATAPSAPEVQGAALGRYTLLEPLGEGGMGAVWRAQQSEPVKRAVALKLIRADLGGRGLVQRFEAERQALALMDHPNIAKVYDAGMLPDGRPFFAMEYVPGKPLAQFCDDAKLDTRRRLEVFVKVCQAVQHAHGKGVIHRDLKPSNILVTTVDGRPEPKVIDFGVAKALGGKLSADAATTRFGDVVGTLEYMAPEQAGGRAGDVDTRADVYALGVILYELLTGLRPFDGPRLRQAALDEAVRILREEDPAKPSTRLSASDALPTAAAVRGTEPARLVRALRGDLDWIAMKCLEKDRERRYETANGVAADVLRHLNDEPVLASPPSAGYRVRKFVRKHRVGVTAAALLLGTLAAGVVGTTWGMFAAQSARVAVAKRAASEEAAKYEAQERAREAEAVLGFVEERILKAARPRGERGGLGHDVTLAKALAASLPAVGAAFAGHPLVEARVRLTIAASVWYLGDAKTAAEQEEAALALRNGALGPEHPLTLESKANLATSYANLGRHAEALRLREEVLARRRARDPDALDVAAALTALANSYLDVGRNEEALTLYQDALARRQARLGRDDPDALVTMSNMAIALSANGRRSDALEVQEEVLARRLVALGPDHPDTLTAKFNLAKNYVHVGRDADALRLREEVCTGRRKALGPDHPDTLSCIDVLAASYQDAGRTADALRLLSEALESVQRTEGRDHGETMRRTTALANAYTAAGRYSEALPIYREQYERRKATLGPDHVDTLNSLSNLASSYDDVGKSEEALRLNEEAFARRKATLGPTHADTLASLNNRGSIYASLGRHEDAMKSREETLTLQRTALGPEHEETIRSAANLAVSYARFGRHADALKLRQEVLAWRRKKFGPTHERTIDALNDAAVSLDDLDRQPDAIKLYEEALAAAKRLPPDHATRLLLLSNLSLDYAAVGRSADAVPLIDEYVRFAVAGTAKKDVARARLLQRLRHFEQANDAAGCRSTAAMFESLLPEEGSDCYNAACAWAVTARVRGTTRAASSNEVDADAARAAGWLEKAVDAGYKNAAKIADDRDLAALRGRDDFKKLLARAKAAAGEK
jgi:serine/threonine protein kinase/tetratricopeptide (TPR) repeat protein